MILKPRAHPISALLMAMALVYGPITALAQSKVHRNVEVEWDTVEGASLYEVQVTRKGDSSKKPTRVKTHEAKWEALIKPGLYLMQIRSFDDRGVPGDWSPASELQVKLPSVAQGDPKPGAVIKATGESSEEVGLHWEPVPGAEKYKVNVRSTSGTWATEHETSDSHWDVKVPVGETFEWTVVGMDAKGEVGNPNASATPFEVKGPPLAKPDIQSPLSKYVREVEWSANSKVKKYSYELSYRNPTTKKWDKLEAKSEHAENKLKLDISRPSGRYRLKVQAFGDHREPSKAQQMDFETYGGFRDPAALETAILRDSINKPTNYYAITSYLITDIKYNAKNVDDNSGSSFNAVGGTGRIGLGYQQPQSQWGGFGIVDLSGFTIQGQNFTFASVEGHVTHKLELGQGGLLLAGAGLFSKELPIVKGSNYTGFTGVGRVREIGPHVGFIYWFPLNDRYGLQFNARAYYTFMGSASNGQKALSSLSYQYGLLGSYRLAPAWMGYAGYAFRNDIAQYSGATDGSTFANGRSSSIDIQGHYLNLLLEFAF